MCVSAKLLSHVWLFATPWTLAHQALLSGRCSRQEHWSRLPCPPSADLPNPGIKPMSLHLLHWQVGSLPLAPPGKPEMFYYFLINWISHRWRGPSHLALLQNCSPGRGALCTIFVGENQKSKSHLHWHKNATDPSERKFSHLPATKLGKDATFFVC